MKSKMWQKAEIDLRLEKLRALMLTHDIDAMLVGTNANLYYIAGRVFAGYAYIGADGTFRLFVRRPNDFEGEDVRSIRKPEQIVAILQAEGISIPEKVGLEKDGAAYNEVARLEKALGLSESKNCSGVLAAARAVKTPQEIELLRESGVRHCAVYGHIPALYREGMTDLELQVEIERELRLNGCLGIFRISGQSMELFMGNLLVGDNADNPSPYDFAMGGGGLNSSLPGGCNGSIIRPGNTVMVDMNGNFTGYMTDMTRTFYVKNLDEHARKAHNLSIAMHRALQSLIRPGVEAKEAYNLCADMAKEAGESDYFMGHRQQAGFVGHGVGIEVNEWPVLAPRSKHVFEKGNVIAIEPKFVIPGVGAVGVESTYVVGDDGIECLTPFAEEIRELL